MAAGRPVSEELAGLDIDLGFGYGGVTIERRFDVATEDGGRWSRLQWIASFW